MAAQQPPAEKASDPNLAGSQETEKVKTPSVALMTPSDQYDQNEPYHNPLGVQ